MVNMEIYNMGNTDYKVNKSQFVSTSTADDQTEEKKWSVRDLYETEFTLDSLVDTLQVLDVFKRKYPNDETIQDFEVIVRDEICQLFGGTILVNEE